MIDSAEAFFRRINWLFVAPIFALLILCVVLIFMVVGCGGYGSPRTKDGQELTEAISRADEKITREEELRIRAAKRIGEYIYYGSILKTYNPRLTETEVFTIGRSISAHAERNSIDPMLIVAVIINESGGDPMAISYKGARGLMQVMPIWERGLGLKKSLFDIDTNIAAGSYILADNIRRWGRAEGVRRYLVGNNSGGEGYVVRVREVFNALKGESNV